MALDPEGEKAAKALMRFKDRLKQYPHNAAVAKELKMAIYDYDPEAGLAEIVARALELLNQQPAAASAVGASGGKSQGGRAKKRRPDEKLVPVNALSQPYRFIELPDQVVGPEEGMVRAPLDAPLANAYTATITVDWIAEGPMLIGGAATGGNAPVEPLKIGNRHVLPGATLRGLVRSIVEMVSYAKMTQGNWHYRFGIRDFYHPYFTEESGVSKVSEVKAGFLRIRPLTQEEKERADIDKFVVHLGNGDLVYELQTGLDWGHVRIPSLQAAGVGASILRETIKDGKQRSYPDWAALPLVDEGNKDGKYKLLGMAKGKSIDFTKVRKFRIVEDDRDKKIYDVDARDGKPGVLVMAGKLPGGGNKIFEYFVTPNESAARRLIPADTAILFERLYSRPGKGDRLEADGNWKILREHALMPIGIPVFYIGDPAKQDSNFFFGLTRLFKVPHKFSVGDVLFGHQPNHRPKFRVDKTGDAVYDNLDFAENLFGYVMEPRDWLLTEDDRARSPADFARKGRVAFGFAPLDPATPAEISSAVEVLQMAPRASYAPFYLKGKEKDYSDPNARIAGRKAYFPRYERPEARKALADFKAFGDRQKQDVREGSPNGKPPGPDVLSNLRFLVPKGERPLVFTGDILLHNVSAAEIGAVLFAITHGGDHEKRFRHMIGRGKPFGAGQFRIGRVDLMVEANAAEGEKRIKDPSAAEIYDLSTGQGFAAEGIGKSLVPFIEAFEDYMRSHLGPVYPLNSPVIKEWLGMSDPEEGARLAAAGKLGYKPYSRDLPSGKDGRPKTFTAFAAYRELREATQMMFTENPPRGDPRLLAAPSKSPPKKR
jgi:CRISPR-associated protein (TIGR03986 family)